MNIDFSIGRIILLTYIIIASNYCTNLFSHGLKEAIENNRIVQHIILLILIMTLLLTFGDTNNMINITNNNQFNIIIMSFIVYAWFVLTTKLDVGYNVGILIILTIYFLYENKKTMEYEIVLKDKNLTQNKKQELINTYNNIQKYLLLTIFGITITGTLLYVNEKQIQYGGGFSLYRFFFY